jgi:hypothetical protein
LGLPRISSFEGISIYMYFRDHNPPHFHAIYGKHQAQVRIPEWTILAGTLPAGRLRRVAEWATVHKAEIEANWRKCCRGERPDKIDPS